MKIDWKHLIVPAIALVIIALCVSAYVHEREDRLRAELTGQLTQKSIDARDKGAADQIQALKDLVAKLKTPEQAAAALPQFIHLPAPIVRIEQPAPTSQNAKFDTYTETGIKPLPSAASATPRPGDYILPAEDLVPMAQAAAKCKTDAIALGTCRQDLTDVKVQRDAATTALKGGTFFTRLKRNAKWFAIGGAVGAGGILATRR